MNKALFTVLAVIVAGGLIGVGLGVGGAKFVGQLIGYSQTLVTPSSVLLALGVSLGIGIFFGFYPANRASRLNPIDALRYE